LHRRLIVRPFDLRIQLSSTSKTSTPDTVTNQLEASLKLEVDSRLSAKLLLPYKLLALASGWSATGRWCCWSLDWLGPATPAGTFTPMEATEGRPTEGLTKLFGAFGGILSVFLFRHPGTSGSSLA
ncbi:AAEL017273-PA, partial [Aedes aegypti]